MAQSFFPVLAETARQATQEGDRERVYRELQTIVQSLTYDPEIRRFIRAADATAREQLFRTVLFKKVHPVTETVLQTLLETGRLGEIDEWWKEYVRHLIETRTGREIMVTTARPLNEKIRLSLKKTLEKKFEMPIFLTELLDPGLKGGLRLQTTDWLFDASLKGRLTRLTHELTA